MSATTKGRPAFLKPFIPVWLDDFGLSKVAFRVYAHFWRRGNPSWPSAAKIARTCRITRDSVWPAIRELEARGLLRRKKGFRSSNTYILLDPFSGNDGPSKAVESEEDAGLRPAELAGQHQAENAGRQSAEKTGHQGITRRETLGRESVLRVGTPPPAAWPPVVPVCVAEGLGAEQGITVEGIQEGYRKFRQRKLTYRDPAPAREADVWEAFIGWLETNGAAKVIRLAHRSMRTAVRAVEADDAPPARWKESAATHATLCVYATGSWESVASSDKAAIRAWTANYVAENPEDKASNALDDGRPTPGEFRAGKAAEDSSMPGPSAP